MTEDILRESEDRMRFSERGGITCPTLCCILIVLLSAVNPHANAADQQATGENGLKIRVAAISFVPVKFDLAGNADRLERVFREAKAGGARLAVAPEGCLEGYVVNEIIAGEAPVERMRDVAIEIDDKVIKRFQKLARELEMCLVFGFAERIGEDVFNGAVFVDQQGMICGKQHKMQLAEGYHPSWWFNRLGAHNRAFDTPIGRCGILICNDRWNPELAKIPVLDGARLLLIPAMGSRSKRNDETVLARGRENGIPVVEANVGVTLIVDEGEIIAVDRKEEGITYAEITVPPPISVSPEERDAQERRFLEWREGEMKKRYQKTMRKVDFVVP
jgi:predicted amidohydrolase